MLNEDVHKILHSGVVERLDKLEELIENLNKPEDGTLAKMRTNLEAVIGKVEAKFNWLVIFILTAVAGALSTIVLAKLGFK